MYRNLVKAMKEDGISQSQIADLIGVRQATVSEKITGKTKFYFDEAVKIKRVFFPRYEIIYLFDNKEDYIV